LGVISKPAFLLKRLPMGFHPCFRDGIPFFVYGNRASTTSEIRERSVRPLTGQPEIGQDDKKTYLLAQKLNRTAKKPTRVAKKWTGRRKP